MERTGEDRGAMTLLRALELLVYLLLWSSGSIASAIGSAHLDVWVFLLWRAAATSAALLLLRVRVRDALPVGRSAWGRVILTGLLMQILYQAAFVTALQAGIAPGILALVLASQPILTAVLTRRRGAAVRIAAVLGSVGLMLACLPDVGTRGTTVLGLVAALVALGAMTAATLLQAGARGTGRWSALTIQNLLAVLVLGGIVLLRGAPLPAPTCASVLPVLWMALAVGVAATGLLYHLLATADVLTVTGVQLLVPGVTAVLDLMVRGTRLAPLTLLGMLITLAAVALLQRGERTRSTG